MPASDRAVPPLVSAEEFNAIISRSKWFATWVGARATRIGRGTATIRIETRPEFLREGGTVAGPVIMGIADIALYAAVMSLVPDGVGAVTADMTMHFLRRPVGAALLAEARLIKPGKRFLVGAVDVAIEGDEAAGPVCHVVGTYAMPR